MAVGSTGSCLQGTEGTPEPPLAEGFYGGSRAATVASSDIPGAPSRARATNPVMFASAKLMPLRLRDGGTPGTSARASSSKTAFLVLPTAATRTRVVATRTGRVSCILERRRLHEPRSNVSEETLETGT